MVNIPLRIACWCDIECTLRVGQCPVSQPELPKDGGHSVEVIESAPTPSGVIGKDEAWHHSWIKENPLYTVADLETVVRDFKAVGEGVTFNFGIFQEGGWGPDKVNQLAQLSARIRYDMQVFFPPVSVVAAGVMSCADVELRSGRNA